MSKKKGRLTQQQINGISCISAILIVSAGLYFFSDKMGDEPSHTDSITNQNYIKLENLEDSVYRSRRRTSLRKEYQNHSQQHKEFNSEQLYSSKPAPVTRKPLTVELNEADTTTLQLLHGIGPTFARRIVRYRERLGGFHCTAQLMEVYGFTPQLLEHIKPYLTLDSMSLQKIPVNSVPLKQFIKHPYVDYYFARDLVSLRSRGEIFSSPDDLRAIPSCTDTMLTRLLPYLDFSDSVTRGPK